MNREFLILRLPDKTPASVMITFQTLRNQYSEHWDDVFKTITNDNGSKFSNLCNLEEGANTLVFYAYPYPSCNKGSGERPNGFYSKIHSKMRLHQ